MNFSQERINLMIQDNSFLIKRKGWEKCITVNQKMVYFLMKKI